MKAAKGPTPDSSGEGGPIPQSHAGAQLNSLEEIRLAQRQFAVDRDWQQFHTPRNLVLALVGEVGELAEIFQWKGEVSPGLPELTPAERVHVGEEISDVLLYAVRLADVCGIDLPQALTAKVQRNADKYPADKCRGSAAKYTALQQAASTDTQPQPPAEDSLAATQLLEDGPNHPAAPHL